MEEVYQYLQGHHPEDRAGFFTAARGRRRGNNRRRTKQERIRLGIRRSIFASRRVSSLLPREVV